MLDGSTVVTEQWYGVSHHLRGLAAQIHILSTTRPYTLWYRHMVNTVTGITSVAEILKPDLGITLCWAVGILYR